MDTHKHTHGNAPQTKEYDPLERHRKVRQAHLCSTMPRPAILSASCDKRPEHHWRTPQSDRSSNRGQGLRFMLCCFAPQAKEEPQRYGYEVDPASRINSQG
jgi:hypothetical protein